MIRTENAKKAELVFYVILLIAAFTAVSEAIKMIDIADVPEVLRPHWTTVGTFFASGIGAFLVAIGYNVYGYLVNYYRSQSAEGIEEETYNPKLLYATLAKFAGFFVTVDVIMAELSLTFGDTEWTWLINLGAKLLFVIINAFMNEIDRLREPSLRII